MGTTVHIGSPLIFIHLPCPLCFILYNLNIKKSCNIIINKFDLDYYTTEYNLLSHPVVELEEAFLFTDLLLYPCPARNPCVVKSSLLA